jgi:hypothetical protein
VIGRQRDPATVIFTASTARKVGGTDFAPPPNKRWRSAKMPTSTAKAALRRPELYRFLDAGGAETIRMRRRPASKKRRCTKSRDAGRRLGGERYEAAL